MGETIRNVYNNEKRIVDFLLNEIHEITSNNPRLFFSLYRVAHFHSSGAHNIPAVVSVDDSAVLSDVYFDYILTEGREPVLEDLSLLVRLVEGLVDSAFILADIRPSEIYLTSLVRSKVWQMISDSLIEGRQAQDLKEIFMRYIFTVKDDYNRDQIEISIQRLTRISLNDGLHAFFRDLGMRRTLEELWRLWQKDKIDYIQMRVMLARLGYITGYPMLNDRIRKDILGVEAWRDQDPEEESQTKKGFTFYADYLRSCYRAIGEELVKNLEENPPEVSLDDLREMISIFSTPFPFKIPTSSGLEPVGKPPRLIYKGSQRYELWRMFFRFPDQVQKRIQWLPEEYRDLFYLYMMPRKKDPFVFAYSRRDIGEILSPEHRYAPTSVSSRLKKLLEFLRGKIYIDSTGRRIREGVRSELYKILSPIDIDPELKEALVSYLQASNPVLARLFSYLYPDYPPLLSAGDLREGMGGIVTSTLSDYIRKIKELVETYISEFCIDIKIE